ncbi:hypothetical protein CALCODRAFT_555459 [Calocera cornea HHB12733]|uniref:Septin-type G domain-containing protein n=1 Tax=Calocera cornea HHB12733 TaxID=1353952 RepID=A0A165FVF3_9BASI|nr:hypothetical protein CALCODRAFT_555459 [Calocera cornea HHB12733]
MPSIFSLSRRKRRPTVSETASTASLPNLDPSEPGLGAWPESLIDADSLSHPDDDPGAPGSTQTTPTKAGATRSAFAVQGGTISFHRPFRPPPSAFSAAAGGMNGSASVPLNLALDAHKARFDPSLSGPNTPTHKRPRAPVQTFNLLVAGARGSGKTSLLNLLLATSHLPPGSRAAQRPRLQQHPTAAIVERKMEVQQGLRRYMLQVVDTPGLELAEGRELEFDRAVQDLVRYQEKRMGEALVMESKVVREMVADQLVHICIYLVDPSSVLPRPAPSSTTSTSTSTDTASPKPAPSAAQDLRMHPRDILAIRRLSARYHVLPLISKSDTLTDRQLSRVKAAVRRDVGEGGGWGVFGFGVEGAGEGTGAGEEKERENGEGEGKSNGNGKASENGNGNGNGHPADPEADPSSSSDDDPSGRTTPKPRSRVIHIRPTSALSSATAQPKLRRARSLSRARPSADSSDSDTPTMSTPAGEKRALGQLLPWAVVAPEEEEEEEDDYNTVNKGARAAPGGMEGDRDGEGEGKRWLRQYRWGEIDVLNKEHCDFWAVKRAVLGVYFKVLRTDTRRVLYEKYRTEKLLARRATRAMSEEERKKILGL